MLNQKHLKTVALVGAGIATLLLTFVVYNTGLKGDFMFDDDVSIVRNQDIQIDSLTLAGLRKAAVSFKGGPLGRPVSMISFALDHYFNQLNPYAFKFTNLVIHLFNGIIVYLFTRLLLIAYWRRHPPTTMRFNGNTVALCITAAWLLSPIGLTSVLYVVQRMNSLAALFTFASLALYLWGRLEQIDGRNGLPGILFALFVTAPLGLYSKENTLLLPVFLFLLEWLILDFQTKTQRNRQLLITAYACILLIPAIVVLSYVASHPQWRLGTYLTRNFSFAERMLTEPRVLWFYIRLILMPDISQFGLFHDDITISKGLLKPASTLFSILGLIGLVVGAYIIRHKATLLSFGVLFFLAGHLMESSIISLEIAHEHRNYLPALGLLIPFVYYLLHLPVRHFSVNLRGFIVATVIALFAFTTHARATYWADELEHWSAEVAYHPNSPTANFTMARTYLYRAMNAKQENMRKQYLTQADRFFTRSYQLDEYYPAGLIGVILVSDAANTTIDPQILSTLIIRLKTVPVSSFSSNLIQQLSQCKLRGQCKIPSATLRSIFMAIFKNPRVTGKSRAVIYSEAMALELDEGNIAQALEYSEAALKYDAGSAHSWNNNIALLIRMGNFAKAKSRLKAFKAKEFPKRIQSLIERHEVTIPIADRFP